AGRSANPVPARQGRGRARHPHPAGGGGAGAVRGAHRHHGAARPGGRRGRARHRGARRSAEAPRLHAGGCRAFSAAGLLPRQRLRSLQPGHARRHVPQPLRGLGPRRCLGGLPLGAGAPLPRGHQGLLGGDAL
ncbi:MAG: hypothetical protein AVDCRST_MAG04-297, partial [uncultured Acetobacteraceae bacterium]